MQSKVELYRPGAGHPQTPTIIERTPEYVQALSVFDDTGNSHSASIGYNGTRIPIKKCRYTGKWSGYIWR